MSMALLGVVTSALDAANRGDSDAFLATFASDGVVAVGSRISRALRRSEFGAIRSSSASRCRLRSQV